MALACVKGMSANLAHGKVNGCKAEPSATSVASSLGIRQRPSWMQEWSAGSLKNTGLTAPMKKKAVVRAQAKMRGGEVVVNLLNLEKIDQEKFSGMPYRRTVFDFDDWKKHKSSARYVRHITSITNSRVIGALTPPVAFMTAIAAAVVGWNELVLLDDLPDWAPVLHMNPLPFSLTAPALSFLLVFRTNSSYGRFDEARKMWGLMLNRTRDFTRQALSYIARDGNEHEKPLRMQLLRHIQAFPITYKHHFLREGDLETELRSETSLTEAEIMGIVNSKHRPNYILTMIGEILGRVKMEPIHRSVMDINLTTFADDIGGCERLFKTPIPLSYTRLTSRFLVLWHVFLPLALWDQLNWLTIPVTFMCASIFFCIEEVGVLIEEPFSILALNAIATTSRTNVGELIALHDQMMANVVSVDGESSNGSAAKSATSSSAAGGSTVRII